ncbi:hypothetical protein [Actinoplanes aureus]|uniref:Uncharacterized protein n=1 Tax=Actinoplanes aureus TaxID=2792083 RepID=A0A931C1L4_9ACTN|nr:hypothetical protein [Actinoplanes aureus]MBG0561639.1 hypothetical protein [Actinoplanes aureus]
MLDSGGTSGGTNWWALRVSQMWSMIEPHDPGTHQHVLGAWKRSYELVLQHLSGVERYRAGLAAAWPPEKSPAAAAYLERLDVLIASLRDTYEAAVENHRALAGATGALDSARQRMAGIQREHAGNEVLLAGHEEEMRVYQLGAGKAKGMPPQSPVAEGRQAELEEQARRVMSSLSSELALAQVSIIQPKPYKAPFSSEISSEFVPDGAYLNPPLPVATPSLTNNGKSSLRRFRAEALGSDRPSNPSPNIGKPDSRAPHSGPVLGEVRPGPTPNGDPTPPTSPKNPITTAPDVNATPPPTRSNDSAFSQLPARGKAIGSYAPDPATKARPFPHNGIIGSMPTSPPRQPAPGRAGIQRVNPVGGLIGHGAPSPRPLGPKATDHDRTTRRDPDTPWETLQGIAPIIRPAPPAKIDPGPVIGLHDQ